MMIASRVCLIALFFTLVSCSESLDERNSPEYWADIMQQPTEEDYLRYREYLDQKTPIERREFLDTVNELRGIISNPPLSETVYIPYEHAYINLVERANKATGEMKDIHLNWVEEMKSMLDSPFRYYNGD